MASGRHQRRGAGYAGVAIGRQPRNQAFDSEGRPIKRPRGRPPKNGYPPVTKTPDNVVLTHSHPHQPLEAEKPTINGSADFPMAVYHKDSKVGALISRQVDSAEELKALGKEWGPLRDLNIETAPAAEGN